MDIKTNIGLEIHVQLKTKSKMFCGCDNDAEGRLPNTLICPICMGFPGVLPVANIQAIEWTIKTALALNCQIAKMSKFDRKHYFYPDLPKNYQISQYDLPFAKNGFLEIENEGERRRVRIRRIHLEEDAAKLIHPAGADYSLVDFNRAGTPLMEIVTEPDIRSPLEAKVFLQQLRQILRYLEVSDADMEKGHLRCDANISISKIKTLGTPVEIKNMNSFKMVERALAYEQERQRRLLESGKKIKRETRGWVDEKRMTVPQRGKEVVSDYRYFPEPDLPPIQLSSEYIKGLKTHLPELPAQRKGRFILAFNLKEKEAETLVDNKSLADYFEEVIAYGIKPNHAANWILVELLGKLNKKGLDLSGNRVLPSHLADLIKMLNRGEISGKMAKEIFEEMVETGLGPGKIIIEKGLKLVTDKDWIKREIKKVIKENPQAISDYKKGKTAALQFLIGQIMRQTKGQASPQTVKKILEEELKRIKDGQN